ncbi:MAG TPA: DUF697 domain-containing protein [Anaerolineae bacterium]|jgi:uncharacterized protein (DUF697 family)|nr:DUF697 domain-containing protein [Anaerolineae bacterium]
MAVFNNINRVRSVTGALSAARGEVERQVSVVVIAEPQIETELLAKLKLRGDEEVITGLHSLLDEKERATRLKGADLALVIVSPGKSVEDLEGMVKQATLAKRKLVIVTGRGIDDWLVENLADVFKVSGEDVAFVQFSDEQAVSEILIPKIVNKLAKREVALAAALPAFREEVAKRIISETAKQNALIGVAVFVPGADMPLLTLNQIKMVIRLAAVYNRELSVKRVSEVMVTIGGGFAFREAASQLVSLIPVAGWAVKGGIAYGGTIAMGQLAKKYFESEIAKW